MERPRRSMARWGPPPWAGGSQGSGTGRGGGSGWGYSQPVLPQAMRIRPPRHDAYRVAATTIDDRGLDSLVAPMFTRAPFVVIVDIVNGEVADTPVVPNVFANAPQGAGVGFAQWLIQAGVRAVVGSNIGRNVAMILQQAGIAIYNVPPNTKVIDALRSVGLVK